jgi:N-acetylglucosaminyl-diphospho-decaprenol L-rhamnosyltransferase
MTDLSIVIVSYNTRDLLDACLASVFQSWRGEGLEVIVVDNASTDDSLALLRLRYPAVILFEEATNAGFARACNDGLRASHGRYVMLLNSDTLALDDALPRVVSFLDANPIYAACGPRLVNRDGSVQSSGYLFTTLADILWESLGLTRSFPNSPLFNRRGLGGADLSDTREVDWVSGACLAVRREVMDDVGLLDDGFFMYDEDVDWCYRMKEAGLRVVFYPKAAIMHYGRASIVQTGGDVAPRVVASRVRYFRKHHGPGAVLGLRLLSALGMALRLAALPLRVLSGRRSAGHDARFYWAYLWASLTMNA